MNLLQRVIGPIATNLYVLGDETSREAIAIDRHAVRRVARHDPRRA